MGTDKSSVALKWASPTDDGGAPITNYVIEYKPTDAFRWMKANENQTVTEYKNPTQRVGLVQSRPHNHLIEN
jgi:hypothetical protein